MLGKAQISPLGVEQGQRWVWRIKPGWRPGLRREAAQAQEWIFEIVQGLIMGSRLQLGFAPELWGPNLASVLGRVQGLSSGFGRGMRVLSGLVQGLWRELELTFGFELSELALQLELMRMGAWE